MGRHVSIGGLTYGKLMEDPDLHHDLQTYLSDTFGMQVVWGEDAPRFEQEACRRIDDDISVINGCYRGHINIGFTDRSLVVVGGDDVYAFHAWKMAELGIEI